MEIKTKFNVGDPVMAKIWEEDEQKDSWRSGIVSGVVINVAKQVPNEIGIGYNVEWVETRRFNEEELSVPPTIEEIASNVRELDHQEFMKAIPTMLSGLGAK
jgi:hypothetical protein